MQILIVDALEPSPTKEMSKLIRTCSLYAESGKPIKFRGRGWERGSGQRFPSHINSATQLAIINRNSIQILNFLDDIGLRKQTE